MGAHSTRDAAERGESGAIDWLPPTGALEWSYRPGVTAVGNMNDFSEEKEARMAQRWASASGPARDARMSRPPARGAPA
eukprot:3616593-Prymnesium_polylepis.1